jgi:tetratricopeptide (TPR) repeat protein
MSDLNQCPDTPALHRFLEGALESDTAQSVAAHLERCRDCRFIVRETAAFLRQKPDDSHPPQKGRGRIIQSRIAVLIAAVIVVAVVLAMTSWLDSGRQFDRMLAGAPIRPGEARLSGLKYSKYVSPRGADSVSPLLRISAEAVLARSFRESDAREWHRRGLAYLVAGKPRPAIESISWSTRLSPRDAHYWVDLAAARIAAGSDELHAAINDSSKAIQLDPNLLEARFNLALALERAGRNDEARAAYADYFAHDAASPWAAEARRHWDQIDR